MVYPDANDLSYIGHHWNLMDFSILSPVSHSGLSFLVSHAAWHPSPFI